MAKNAEDYRLPPGWSRQQVQVPSELAEQFKAACVAEGHGGVKLVSTAAVALFLGIPQEVRDALVAWVAQNSRKQMDRITPDEAWKLSRGSFGHLFPDRPNVELIAGKDPALKAAKGSAKTADQSTNAKKSRPKLDSGE